MPSLTVQDFLVVDRDPQGTRQARLEVGEVDEPNRRGEYARLRLGAVDHDDDGRIELVSGHQLRSAPDDLAQLDASARLSLWDDGELACVDVYARNNGGYIEVRQNGLGGRIANASLRSDHLSLGRWVGGQYTQGPVLEAAGTLGLDGQAPGSQLLGPKDATCYFSAPNRRLQITKWLAMGVDDAVSTDEDQRRRGWLRLGDRTGQARIDLQSSAVDGGRTIGIELEASQAGTRLSLDGLRHGWRGPGRTTRVELLGEHGTMEFRDIAGDPAIRLDSSVETGPATDDDDPAPHISRLSLLHTNDRDETEEVIGLDSAGGVRIGGHERQGELTVRDKDGHERIVASAADGSFSLRTPAGAAVARLDARANLDLGGSQMGGDIRLIDNDDRERMHLHSRDGSLTVKDEHGNTTVHFDGDGKLSVRGEAHCGHLRVQGRRDDAVAVTPTALAFHDGGERRAVLDRSGLRFSQGGEITLEDPSGATSVSLSGGGRGYASIGNASRGPAIQMFGSGVVQVVGRDGTVGIRLDGDSGAINATGTISAAECNCDCAELFDTLAFEIEPGSVMVHDGDGRSVPCSQAYDRKAVGVVSGAGSFRPAMLLGDRADRSHTAPIALVGRVWCKADASFGAIDVGDLLTTSPTPGHAMVASDPARAFGAVVGKALSRLDAGTGMVLMLVTLQ
ncbi:MAG: hypothetical protein H6742_16635 [Alphaproteobacteria bacterium]|nr:hypothetical protein [Alphaproteobacteria bacterium]